MDKNKTTFTKLGSRLAQTIVNRLLDLNPEALAELQRVDTY